MMLASLLALTLAACADGQEGARRESPAGAVRHVHGLASDPRDGALYVATHRGLFRAPAGQSRLTPVGRSRHDLMGFTIDGRRFIASGHPDPRAEGMPSHLGLIESPDKGETWAGRALYGQADLHLLEASGARVYAVDAPSGRVLFSRDGGRRWAGREAPGQVFSLAIDPRNSRRLVMATEFGLYLSNDEARSWTRVAGSRTGLVEWPERQALWLLGAEGTVERSRDAGRTWARTGAFATGRPTAFDAELDALFVSLEDGRVLQSSDAGRTWSKRAAP